MPLSLGAWDRLALTESKIALNLKTWVGRGGVEGVRGGILEVTRTLLRRNQSKAIHSTHFQSQLLPSANCGNPGKALELYESVISPQKAGAWFLAKACRKCVS